MRQKRAIHKGHPAYPGVEGGGSRKTSRLLLFSNELYCSARIDEGGKGLKLLILWEWPSKWLKRIRTRPVKSNKSNKQNLLKRHLLFQISCYLILGMYILIEKSYWIILWKNLMEKSSIIKKFFALLIKLTVWYTFIFLLFILINTFFR